MKGDDRGDNVRDFPHERRNDGDLVVAVAHGDEQSLAILFRRHAASLRRTLYGCIGGHASIDDLVQEAFLSLMRNAGKVREPEKVRAYLLGAALQLARRKDRQEARRRRWLGLFIAETPHEVVGPVVHQRVALRKLEGILGEMPMRYRESFVLRFVEGFSTAEIAKMRSVSLATAKRDVLRARDRVVLRARSDEELNRYLLGEVIQSPDARCYQGALDELESDQGQP